MLIKEYPLRSIEHKFEYETDVKIRERLHLILFLRKGYVQREVSEMLRISVGLVPYWKKRFETYGFEGLYDKEGRGVKRELSDEELSMLRSALDEQILTPDGYSRGWKSKDVRILIKENFEVEYTRQHICRLLHLVGCSLQFPRPRHKRRNQESVDKFKQEFKKKEKLWVAM